jgi:tetratricopeptide (TPR) repeat protein
MQRHLMMTNKVGRERQKMLDPSNVGALDAKGNALRDLRSKSNVTEAITYYDRALAIDPNNKQALNDKQVAICLHDFFARVHGVHGTLGIAEGAEEGSCYNKNLFR